MFLQMFLQIADEIWKTIKQFVQHGWSDAADDASEAEPPISTADDIVEQQVQVPPNQLSNLPLLDNREIEYLELLEFLVEDRSSRSDCDSCSWSNIDRPSRGSINSPQPSRFRSGFWCGILSKALAKYKYITFMVLRNPELLTSHLGRVPSHEGRVRVESRVTEISARVESSHESQGSRVESSHTKLSSHARVRHYIQ